MIDSDEEVYRAENIVVDESCRNLLLNYARIPTDDVQQHAEKIWDQALLVSKSSSTSHTRTLLVNISKHPIYAQILQRVQQDNHRLLEINCSLGQNLRQLAFDGVDTRNLQGLELKLGLTELGFDLFRDENSFRGSFSAGDILSQAGIPGLQDGSFDIIHAGTFLDKQDEHEQVQALTRMIRLLKPRSGSLVFGSRLLIEPTTNATGSNRRDSKSHGARSFRDMVKIVGIDLGVELDVQESANEKTRSDFSEAESGCSHFTVLLR